MSAPYALLKFNGVFFSPIFLFFNHLKHSLASIKGTNDTACTCDNCKKSTFLSIQYIWVSERINNTYISTQNDSTENILQRRCECIENWSYTFTRSQSILYRTWNIFVLLDKDTLRSNLRVASVSLFNFSAKAITNFFFPRQFSHLKRLIILCIQCPCGLMLRTSSSIWRFSCLV